MNHNDSITRFHKWRYSIFSYSSRLEKKFRFRFTTRGHFLIILTIVTSMLGLDAKISLIYQSFVLCLTLLLVSMIISRLLPIAKVSVEISHSRSALSGSTFDTYLYLNNPTKKTLCLDLWLEVDSEHNFPSLEKFVYTPLPEKLKKINKFDQKVGYPKWKWLLDQSRGMQCELQERVYCPPGKSTLKLPITLLKRGAFQFKSCWILQEDPMGFVRKRKEIPYNGKVLSLPKLVSLKTLPFSKNHQQDPNSHQLITSVGESEEFLSLRDYRAGDTLRNIHWKSTAKTGSLRVKEYHDEWICRHALLVDLHFPADKAEAFENMLRVAASLLAAPLPNEWIIDFVILGDTILRKSLGRGTGELQHILESIARVQPIVTNDIQDKKEMPFKDNQSPFSSIIVLSHDLNTEDLISLKALSLQKTNVNVLLFDRDKNVDHENLKTHHFYSSEDLQEQLNQFSQST